MKVSKLALAAALAVAGPAVGVAAPAEAQGVREAQHRQRQQQQQQAQRPQAPTPQLTAAERAAIMPALQAAQQRDWEATRAALPAAEAAAQSPGARYLVGQIRYELAVGINDVAMQTRAIEEMLASGGAPEDQIGPLLNNQVAYALRANNFQAAEQGLARIVEREPNNVERILQLAEVKARLGRADEAAALYRRAEPELARQLAANPTDMERLSYLAQIRRNLGQNAEALALYQQALRAAGQSGQRLPEPVYRQALALAYEAGMAREAAELSRQLLTAYPTPQNWRQAVLVYRQSAGSDAVLNLDIRRFMRAAQLLQEAGDYVELADALRRGGLPGEAKAVLDEGVSRGVLSANDRDIVTLRGLVNPLVDEDRASLAGLRGRALAGSGTGREARGTADAYFGYGEYAEAAELYRAALQKGGEDANLLNLRLGAALALAGRRAEAEAALRSVTGPRSGLAAFWLLWLAGRG